MSDEAFELGDFVFHTHIQKTLGIPFEVFYTGDTLFYEVFWVVHPDNEEFGEQTTTITSSKYLRKFKPRKNSKLTS